MIGHLQRNKVKYIVDKVALIHSVDSLRLAETIEHEAAKHNVTVPVLIEVNVAQEESKFGLKTEEVLSLVESVAAFPHIHIEGLMTGDYQVAVQEGATMVRVGTGIFGERNYAV